MNLLTNYPDELVLITIRLLQNSYQNPTYPYCGKTACDDCTVFDSKSERSRCNIEIWCTDNAKDLMNGDQLAWLTFQQVFYDTSTLNKYPEFYI